MERGKVEITALKLEQKYAKKYTKKFSGKPEVIQTIAHRTLSTATCVLAEIQDVPYDELALSIYLYCQDAGFRPIADQFAAQIELAGANPDKFVFGLHSFYVKIVKEIAEAGLWREFLGFLSACLELKHICVNNEDININVVTAYLNLLIQTAEYSRPNRFDLRQVLIGVTTTGELMSGDAFYPHSDQPTIEMRKLAAAGQLKKFTPAEIGAMVARMYREQGIDIRASADAEAFQQIQRIRDTTYMAMMPYINEFTADILPKMEFQNKYSPVDGIRVLPAMGDVLSALKARKRTLPANGVSIEFADPQNCLSGLFMKEVVYEKAVVMLYRLETVFGDLCGYFNTRTGFFYSVFIEADGNNAYVLIRSFVLYCYALTTTNVFSVNEDAVLRGGEPVKLKLFNVGGKLRDVYHTEAIGEGMSRAGNPDYKTQQAAVNGYIRRLPAGQGASEEALEYARAMGYDLALGETYVQPFSKIVFVRRQAG